MIDLVIRIGNPWGEKFKNLGSVSGLITKHTAWELEHYYDAWTLFELACSYSVRTDHAGLKLSFCLIGYTIGFTIYDTRHWDYEKNCWCTYDKENLL